MDQPVISREQHAVQAADASQYSRSALTYASRTKKRRKRRLIKLIIILVIVAIIATPIGVFAYTGVQANVLASQTVKTGTALVDDILDSDSESMKNNAQIIDENLGKMDSITHGFVWQTACKFPVIGSDLEQTTQLVEVANDLSDSLVMPVCDTLEQCPVNMLLDGGNINGTALNSICTTLLSCTPVVEEAATTVNGMKTFHIQQLAYAVKKVKEPLNSLSAALSENGGLIKELPAIFGCEGPRYYLVVAQNEDELRPSGGMPGTYIPITIENGKMSFGEATSATELRAKTDSYGIKITDEEKKIYTHNLGDVASDFNKSADFSRDGEIMAQGWQKFCGEEVDGIIGMDVVMFQRLIELASESVTLDDGSTVASSELASILLHDACWKFLEDEDFMSEMDEYDEAVLSSALSTFRSSIGQADLSDVVDTAMQGIEERRILVWMEDDEEEAAIDALGAAGTLFNSEEEPTLGVYFFDYTYSKMDWYLHTETKIVDTWTDDDGVKNYKIQTTLQNNITADETLKANSYKASSGYITGGNSNKIKDSDMITCVYLYAPMGGSFGSEFEREGGTWKSDFMADDRAYKAGFQSATHDGHAVEYGIVHLTAGEKTTITYTVKVSEEAEEDLQIFVTPTVN